MALTALVAREMDGCWAPTKFRGFIVDVRPGLEGLVTLALKLALDRPEPEYCSSKHGILPHFAPCGERLCRIAEAREATGVPVFKNAY